MMRSGVTVTLLREQGITDHDELFHVLQALHFHESKAVDAIDNVVAGFGDGNHGIGAAVVAKANEWLAWLRSERALYDEHVADLMERAGPQLAAWRQIGFEIKTKVADSKPTKGLGSKIEPP
jgi:hypothetical protein